MFYMNKTIGRKKVAMDFDTVFPLMEEDIF